MGKENSIENFKQKKKHSRVWDSICSDTFPEENVVMSALSPVLVARDVKNRKVDK